MSAATWAVVASAIATAVMAGFTAYLAYKTKGVSDASLREAKAVEKQGDSLQKQAEATTEQADLTRQSLRASNQPWLTLGDSEGPRRTYVNGEIVESPGEGPFTFFENGAQLGASLALRNVGTGLTIIDPRRSHLIGWPSQQATNQAPMDYVNGQISNPIVPPGEQARIYFSLEFERWQIDFQTLTHQHNNDGEVYFDVVYGDVTGNTRSRARFFVSQIKAEHRWIVYGIDYFTPPENETASPSVRFQ